jgi:hypothetical protein
VTIPDTTVILSTFDFSNAPTSIELSSLIAHDFRPAESSSTGKIARGSPIWGHAQAHAAPCPGVQIDGVSSAEIATFFSGLNGLAGSVPLRRNTPGNRPRP